ncbi:MAG: Serine/threonine protein kinase [Labilithrix sp.]|nr:Serine/threonine protein kinase [Labilithrix sp.]
MPIAPGETFERYEIESLIGRGGVGEVYRAHDTRLHRKVALKVLRADREDEGSVSRLFREARAAAGLTHPSTVAIHDIGDHEGIVYIVMELVQGAPLSADVGDGAVPVARKVGWLLDIARALAAAHKAGIVHRDVKPANVMVSDEGAVKVLDFGLARPLVDGSFRTQHGHVLGTPRYMAPEQLAGGAVDGRSDQYSCGLLAYELLSGSHPGGALAGVPEPSPLDEVTPEVGPVVGRIVSRMLALVPEERFASMDEVVSALEDARSGRPVRVFGAASGDRGDVGEAATQQARAGLGSVTQVEVGAPAGSVALSTESSPALVAARRAQAQEARALAALLPAADLARTLPSRDAGGPVPIKTLLSGGQDAKARVATQPLAEWPRQDAPPPQRTARLETSPVAHLPVPPPAGRGVADGAASPRGAAHPPAERLVSGAPRASFRPGAGTLVGALVVLAGCAFAGAYYGSRAVARETARAGPAASVATSGTADAVTTADLAAKVDAAAPAEAAAARAASAAPAEATPRVFEGAGSAKAAAPLAPRRPRPRATATPAPAAPSGDPGLF